MRRQGAVTGAAAPRGAASRPRLPRAAVSALSGRGPGRANAAAPPPGGRHSRERLSRRRRPPRPTAAGAGLVGSGGAGQVRGERAAFPQRCGGGSHPGGGQWEPAGSRRPSPGRGAGGSASPGREPGSAGGGERVAGAPGEGGGASGPQGRSSAVRLGWGGTGRKMRAFPRVWRGKVLGGNLYGYRINRAGGSVFSTFPGCPRA